MTPTSDVVARLLTGIGAQFDDELTLSGDEARALHALISSLVAENEALDAKLSGIATCACSYDAPDEVCMHHSPQLLAAQASHKAARENFLTMQGAAAKLLEDANDYKATMLTNYERALTAERLLAEAREALNKSASLLEVVAEDAQKRGDTATWAMADTMATDARASIGGVNG
jgi:hypothetical protein